MDAAELRGVEGFDMLGDRRLEELAMRARELQLDTGDFLFRGARE